MAKTTTLRLMSLTLALICVSETVSFLLGYKMEWVWLLPWLLFSIYLLVCMSRNEQYGEVKEEKISEEEQHDIAETKKEEQPVADVATRRMIRIVSLNGDGSKLDITTLFKNKEITTRVYNILLKSNITNLMDLTMYRSADICEMKGMGKKSSVCLKKVMKKYDIHFNSPTRRKIMR